MAQGAALQCSEPSVIPLSYPGTPIVGNLDSFPDSATLEPSIVYNTGHW